MDSDNDNGRDCPNKPEAHNLARKNTLTNTKDNKNIEADYTTEPPKKVENPVPHGTTINPHEN